MGRGLREKGTGNHESDPKMLWYLGNIWDYGLQMLPSALAAAAVFFCLRPWRRRRLAALGLTRGPWVFFVLLGNLSMFAPLGCFSALLWDGPGWRKALLTGVCSSLFVEITPL